MGVGGGGAGGRQLRPLQGSVWSPQNEAITILIVSEVNCQLGSLSQPPESQSLHPCRREPGLDGPLRSFPGLTSTTFCSSARGVGGGEKTLG